MNPPHDLPSVHEGLLATLSFDERSFYDRVWATPSSLYRSRLEAIAFSGLNRVLDAGCGFGQWSAALASLNKEVHAVDSSPRRSAIASARLSSMGADVEVHTASILDLPFADASLDAVFCYSVIYMVDPRRALREFRRVLGSRGRLYICANGYGWQVREIGFLVRAGKISLTPFRTIASGLLSHDPETGVERVVSSKRLARYAAAQGFEDIRVAPEGTLGMDETKACSFFPGRVLGLEAVYELVARAPDRSN